mgnify:CR=1 FL=1
MAKLNSGDDTIVPFQGLDREKLQVLVLDPGGEIKQLLDLLLAPIAGRILHVRSAEEGFALALAKGPDLIVAFNGPYDLGSRLCALVRQEPSIGNTPFLILTSSNVKEYPAYLESGCDQILPIPFRCQDFFAAIRSALARIPDHDPQAVQVLLPSGKALLVETQELDRLIERNGIVCFRRRDGVAVIGRDPVRSGQPAGYTGEDRRRQPAG